LIAALLLPNIAVSADPAADAYQKGKTYLEKGDSDAAIAAFTEAIRLDPKLANAYSDRGVAYEGKGEIDKAIADYTEAIRLDPKTALAYYNRGIAYARKGDLDKAIADYTEVIRLNPKLAQAYSNRAAAYEKKGENAKAEADFAEAEKLGYKGRTARATPGGVLGNPWVTVSLILGAVICLALYWIVRKRRLSSNAKQS
jgi:tetratricopeptide (TPR) repeat protein